MRVDSAFPGLRYLFVESIRDTFKDTQSADNGLFTVNAKHWSERARERAKELKLTDVRIAEITGWSTSSVSLWMNGAREPKLEQKMAMAKALQVSLSWLETGEETMDSSHLAEITFEDVEAYLAELESKERIIQKNPGIRIIESESQNSFVVLLDNDTMIDPTNAEKMHIPEGSRVQIDVDHQPKPGNIILIEHEGITTLRLWKRINDNLHHLRIINPLYHNLHLTHEGPITEIYRGTAVGFSKSLL